MLAGNLAVFLKKTETLTQVAAGPLASRRKRFGANLSDLLGRHGCKPFVIRRLPPLRPIRRTTRGAYNWRRRAAA